MTQLQDNQAERILSYPALHSIQTAESHPLWGGRSVLLSPANQAWISPEVPSATPEQWAGEYPGALGPVAVTQMRVRHGSRGPVALPTGELCLTERGHFESRPPAAMLGGCVIPLPPEEALLRAGSGGELVPSWGCRHLPGGGLTVCRTATLP